MVLVDERSLEHAVALLVEVEKTVEEKFSGMAAGLSLPPGMKLPF